MCFEQETQQTSSTSIPKYITNAGKSLVRKAENLTKPYQPYTGERVAGFTGDQENAFQSVRDIVASAPQVGDEALAGARTYASAPGQSISTERIVDEDGRLGKIDDYMNPYTKLALDSAIAEITREADRQSNRIGAQATSAGAFGDARHGILESLNNLRTSEAVGDTAGNFLTNAFNTAMNQRSGDLNRFLNADQANAQYAETALGRGLTGSGALIDRAGAEQSRLLNEVQALLGVGNQQQNNEQAQLDADYEEFWKKYLHQFSSLEALGGALRGAPFETSQTTTQTEPDNSGIGLAGSIAGSIFKNPGSLATIGTTLAGI